MARRAAKKKELWQRLKKHLHLSFVPHKKNGFLPKAVQHKALFGYSFFLLATKGISLFLLLFLPAASTHSSAITTGNIVDLTNSARRNSDLAPLTLNDKLSAAADAKAEDMLKGQYFAHTSPTGTTPWQWIRGAGYTYSVAAENLAVHYFESEDVQAAWMASPSHRANILDPRFSEIGIGIAEGTFENANAIVVVQMFGAPKNIVPAVVATAKPVSDITPTPAADVLGVTDEPVSTITSTTVTPTDTLATYKVALKSPEAVSANVIYNGAMTPLTETAPHTFEGEVTAPEVNRGENTVVATVTNEEGVTTTEPVAVLTTNTDTIDVYSFVPARSIELFRSIDVDVLHDGFAMLYAAVAILLVGLLLSTILIRFEHQHHSVNAHIALVILLSGALALL